MQDWRVDHSANLKPKQGTAHYGTQAPPGQVPWDTGRKNTKQQREWSAWKVDALTRIQAIFHRRLPVWHYTAGCSLHVGLLVNISSEELEA